jgi:DnaJ-class molecular chaperone
MKCQHCKGTGIHLRGKVLGWGIAIPNMPCRNCLGAGILKKTIKEN